MISPFCDKVLVVRVRVEELSFRKDTFEVLCHFCADDEMLFTTEELDEINIKQVYNQYLEKYNFPFEEEMRSFRAHYQLFTSKIAEFLGHIFTDCTRQGRWPALPMVDLFSLVQTR